MPFSEDTDTLSLFLPPAENPLFESGAWGPLAPAQPQLKKSGGIVSQSTQGPVNYSVWMQQQFNSDSPIEVWICTEGGQLGAAVETWRVALFTEIGSGWDGYLVYYGGGIGKEFVIRKYSDGVPLGIATGGGGYPAKLGIRIDGAAVQAWAWYNPSGPWQLVSTVNDSSYRGAFYASIGIEDPTVGGLAITCFGVNTFNRTQIYRLVQG